MDIFDFQSEPSLTGMITEVRPLGDKTNVHKDLSKCGSKTVARTDTVEGKEEANDQTVRVNAEEYCLHGRIFQDVNPFIHYSSGMLSGTPCGTSTPVDNEKHSSDQLASGNVLSDAIELLRIQQRTAKTSGKRKYSGLFIFENERSVNRSFSEIENEMSQDEEDDLTTCFKLERADSPSE